MTTHYLTETFSGNKEAILSLLHKELANYLSGSSSLPVDEVENLLQSMLFVLSHGKADGVSIPLQFEAGKKQLKQQLVATKELYQQVLNSMLPLKVEAYWQTVQNIQHFFTAYDLEYHAHEVPASIDYLLAEPVDDLRYKGLDFIHHYLLQLSWENRFCAPYADHLDELFHCYEQQLKVNYRYDINNLFSVIFKQTLAKRLIDKKTTRLILSQSESRLLSQLLAETSDIRLLLGQTLTHLLKEINLSDQQYYYECLESVSVNLEHTLAHGTIDNFFLTDPPEELSHIFISNTGLVNTEFTQLIEELPDISSSQLPNFLADKFNSLNDYWDLLTLDILSDQDVTAIINRLDCQSLIVLLKMAGREVDEAFSSFETTLDALTASQLPWLRLLAHEIINRPVNSQQELKQLFQQLALPLDDFD